MKLSEELVLIEDDRVDGGWFIRGMRSDHRNHKYSPAQREIMDRVRTASKGARGFGFYKGRRMPNSSIALARANGMPATQPHHSFKEERRAALWQMFERSGIVLVSWYGKIVSFFTPPQIRYYEQQAANRERRKRERALKVIAS